MKHCWGREGSIQCDWAGGGGSCGTAYCGDKEESAGRAGHEVIVIVMADNLVFVDVG
jgi:hypothetical protein